MVGNLKKNSGLFKKRPSEKKSKKKNGLEKKKEIEKKWKCNLSFIV